MSKNSGFEKRGPQQEKGGHAQRAQDVQVASATRAPLFEPPPRSIPVAIEERAGELLPERLAQQLEEGAGSRTYAARL
jgi:hypothetical protein